jgi:hypothetical protein
MVDGGGLKIEERELSLLERVRIYGVDKIQTNDAGYYEHSYAQFKVDEAKIPTRAIIDKDRRIIQ